MQREQIENIIGSLDTESLIKMLNVVGIQINPEEVDDANELQAENEKPTSWNDLRVDVGQKQERPPLHSPENYLRNDANQEARPNVQGRPGYMDNPQGMEPWYVDQASLSQG
jgi:hypothetical protein